MPALPVPPAPHPAVAPQKTGLLEGSMQVPLHWTCEAAHVTAQAPAPLHTVPDAQLVPGDPASPAPHAPLAPQCWLSRSGSMHWPPQLIWLAAHVTEHAPPLHTWPLGHLWPHAPQLVLSTVRSRHMPTALASTGPPSAIPPSAGPPHSVRPGLQLTAQAPFEHTSPAAHALPQLPQLAGSTFSETHTPLHIVVPPTHASAQAPLEQTLPAGHVLPHAPQLAGSIAVSTHEASPQATVPPLHGPVASPKGEASDGVASEGAASEGSASVSDASAGIGATGSVLLLQPPPAEAHAAMQSAPIQAAAEYFRSTMTPLCFTPRVDPVHRARVAEPGGPVRVAA